MRDEMGPWGLRMQAAQLAAGDSCQCVQAAEVAGYGGCPVGKRETQEGGPAHDAEAAGGGPCVLGRAWTALHTPAYQPAGEARGGQSAPHRAKLPASPRGCVMGASELPVKFVMAGLKLHGS